MTEASEAMGMAEPEKRRVTVGDIVQAALDDLGDPYEDTERFGEDGWKAPFAVARRIQMALFKHGVDYSSIPVSEFFPPVQEWVDYWQPDVDSFMLGFARMWGEVLLPEGYDPAEFAYGRTMREDWRLEVDPAYYTNVAEVHDAATILTFFAHLQDWLREEQEYAYGSTRKLGGLVGKSHEYVAELIRCLRAEGALLEMEPGTARRAPRYLAVHKSNERKPLAEVDRRYRRYRRSEDADGLGDVEENSTEGGSFRSFLDGEVPEGGFEKDDPGGGVQ